MDVLECARILRMNLAHAKVSDRFKNHFQNRTLEQHGNEDRHKNQAHDLSLFHARNVITFRLPAGM
jgi:hypothetical protein